jgi:hypothetical protein
MILPKVFLPLSLALTGALSATVPKTDFDVIVVGGGPAGLSALSGLSRVRRTAALFDSHQYRNDPTREMHDVIGNDGILLPCLVHIYSKPRKSNYKEQEHPRPSSAPPPAPKSPTTAPQPSSTTP